MTPLQLVGIPEWVERSWLQPLRAEDDIFRLPQIDEPHCPPNTIIQEANDDSYAEGYRVAARILADDAFGNAIYSDCLIWPVVYLYRHAVELHLKRLVWSTAYLYHRQLSNTQRRALHSHPLDALWRMFKVILADVDDSDDLLDLETIAGVDSYVRQLQDADPDSTALRYATNQLAGHRSI